MEELLKAHDNLMRSWESYFLNAIRESQPEWEAKAIAVKIFSGVDSEDLTMKTTVVVGYADRTCAYKTWPDKDLGTHDDVFDKFREWVESLNAKPLI